jgi:hypothetical protein
MAVDAQQIDTLFSKRRSFFLARKIFPEPYHRLRSSRSLFYDLSDIFSVTLDAKNSFAAVLILWARNFSQRAIWPLRLVGRFMSTEAQIAANRANAQLSKGPKTKEGKAVSSNNNFRHGFTGAFMILSWERYEEFDTLLSGLRAEHLPATITENLLVEKMAQSWWLRTRALLLQNNCFSDSIDQKQLALYLRYQTTHDRAFHKSLNDLLKLRAEKRKMEIGFESQQMKQSCARQQAERERERAQHKHAEEARKQAAEKRRQELHKWKVLLAEAEVDHRVMQNLNLETLEHRITVGPERIIATQNAA